jgi:hypothetical protein
VIFGIGPWRIGEGFYVTVALPDSELAGLPKPSRLKAKRGGQK